MTQMGSFLVLGCLVLVSTLSSAHGDQGNSLAESRSRNGCPELAGVFACPASGAESAYQMTITEEYDPSEGSTTYHWNYTGKSAGVKPVYTCSPKGVFNPNMGRMWGVCHDGGAYISASAEDLSGSARNEIDRRTGAYVATTVRTGAIQVYCPRVMKRRRTAR